jgi:biopolymer transport protein ExbD
MTIMSSRRGARVPAASQSDFAPIAAINTTPLIDMMLVILIMLIVTIPMSTHKVPLDLPGPSPVFPPTPPPVHRLSVQASGALLWDGQALPPSALPGRLAAFQADPLLPVLELNAEGEARYERVDQIFAQIRHSGVTRLGFVGNEGFAAALDRQGPHRP